MKSLFLQVIIVAWTVCAFAQMEVEKGYPLEVSKPYRVEDASNKVYFAEYDEIMSVKVSGEEITIQKFNSEKMVEIGREKYNDLPSGFVVESIREYNDRYYFFYSLWDKRNENEQLFVRELDFQAGKFKGEDRLLIKINGRITGSPFAALNFGFFGFGIGVVDKFDFFTSKDESKMVVQYRKKPAIKRDKINHDVIGLAVFDKNIEKLWEKEVRMPYTEKKMNNLDYSVDSDGNSYLLAKVFDTNSTKSKGKDGNPNYHIELFRIKANTNKIEIVPIKIEDQFVRSIWIYEGYDNNMICAGFYNKGNDFADADGIFLFDIQNDGPVSEMRKYEIPVEVLNQYTKTKTQKKNKKKDKKDKAEFENLVLREFLIQEDGGLILIGEQYFVEEITRNVNGRIRTTYIYHYRDMLITKIGADGNLAWMKKLPKRQRGGKGQGGMSYKYVNHLGDHTLVFLDNVANLELPLNKIPATHVDGFGGFLTGYRVNDDTGEVTKISFMDTRDVKGIEVYQFHVNRILSISPVEFAVEVYKKRKEDVLIKIGLVK